VIRVIVVDDELPSLRKLERQLATVGLACTAASFTEPAEALAYLKENEADAVFMDIEMPGMDGIELATRMLDLQPGISVIFVTAYNEYAVEAFRLNALDYLLKPVSSERLIETISRLDKQPVIPHGFKSLAVRSFGNFSVAAGDTEVKFRTEKAAELMAFMIDNRGDFVSRDKIIDSLWEDFEGDRAVVHFNTTLHNMKKALFSMGIRLPIVYDRGNYRLVTEDVESDYYTFCALVENNKTIDPISISECELAAALYKGEYLSGWEHPWVAGKRLLLEDMYIRLLLNIADYYKSTGNLKKAAYWLQTGLLHEPLHRELNLSLIQILLLMRETVMADKYYRQYRSGLLKKFSLEPDGEFLRLFE
jgi:two-component system LytT family response regulator